MSDILLGIALFTVIVMALILTVLIARSFILRQVEATVTVNGDQKLETLTGEKLLTVLHDNGILIPSACAGAGTCGLCQVTVTNGGGEALPTGQAIPQVVAAAPPPAPDSSQAPPSAQDTTTGQAQVLEGGCHSN